MTVLGVYFGISFAKCYSGKVVCLILNWLLDIFNSLLSLSLLLALAINCL